MEEGGPFKMLSCFEMRGGVRGYVGCEGGGRERGQLGEFGEEEEGVDVCWLRTG